MNVLPVDKRVLILKCLTESVGMRATARIADVSRQTVSKLLVDAGRACADYQDKNLRDLPCRRLEVDEIWEFVYAKRKNAPTAKNPPRVAGDVWTWVALCADTKLVPSWLVGDRGYETALEFLSDLRLRLAHRVQLTTDGHSAYVVAVDEAFGGEIDHALLVKLYGTAGQEDGPRQFVTVLSGEPERKSISTSYVERQNLTMRMQMRRFTRKTNAFSKRVEMHAHAVALHFFHYNFCRIHETIRVAPAMEAGVTSRLWDARDILRLVEEAAPTPNRPSRYRTGKS